MALTSLFGKVSKRVWALVAIATATVAMPAVLLAWGPSRPTYTMAHPADHVTFNSITDNPVQGDERNFVQIRNVTTNSKFGETTNLVPGDEYEVYVFYHNDAASNLNDAAHNYKGVATGAYMKAELPASVAAGSQGRVNGYVGASNASPKEVWDEAYMTNNTAGGIDIRIESGSAKITNNGKTNGKTLSDKLFTTGTSLGYDALDGKLPGCTQYSGYVTYKFKADQPNFTVAKTVSAHGANTYGENVSAKAGNLVDFKIQYKNTGTTQQDGVVIRDTLPKNLSYVNGTTYVANSATGNQWKAVSADTVAKQGINIGSYAPGAGGFVKFTAKVAAESALACGTNKLTNTAAADTQNGSKSDTASVTVDKTCTPPKQVKACDLDTLKIVTVDETKIDNVHYTLDLTKCTPPKQVKACDLDTLKIVTVDESKIDNVHYTLDLSKCQPKPVQVEACNLDTMKVEMVDKSKIDNVHYTTDLSKCAPKPKTVEACNIDTGVIETVDESKVDNVHYTTDLTKCQEQVCRISDKTTVTINKSDFDSNEYTTDLSACESTPETPTELPHTGMSDGILSVIGLGSLVGVSAAYIASRRQ